MGDEHPQSDVNYSVTDRVWFIVTSSGSLHLPKFWTHQKKHLTELFCLIPLQIQDDCSLKANDGLPLALQLSQPLNAQYSKTFAMVYLRRCIEPVTCW